MQVTFSPVAHRRANREASSSFRGGYVEETMNTVVFDEEKSQRQDAETPRRGDGEEREPFWFRTDAYRSYSAYLPVLGGLQRFAFHLNGFRDKIDHFAPSRLCASALISFDKPARVPDASP